VGSLGERGAKHVVISFRLWPPPPLAPAASLARFCFSPTHHSQRTRVNTPERTELRTTLVFSLVRSSITTLHFGYPQAQSGHTEKPAAPRSCSRPPAQLAGSLPQVSRPGQKAPSTLPTLYIQHTLLESIYQPPLYSTIVLYLTVR
jgi:hypothetical protein